MSIRITVATGLYPPEIGGPATYTQMLEAHLTEPAFSLTVVPFGSVRRHPKGLRHIVYVWKLYQASANADLIYALDPVSVGLPARIVSALRKKPFWLRVAGDYAWEQGQQRFSIHDSLDDFVANANRYPLSVRILRWIQTSVARHAERVIVPSEYMKRIVESWSEAIGPVTRIYSALFPIPVSGTKQELREMLEYDGLVVSTAARLVPWKGMASLIEAIATLRRQNVDAHLVIIGDGPLLDDLQAHAHALGVDEYVRLVGRQSKDALGAAIKGSDVFVLNTQYEGLSHQLLEVMDLGVPIVTTPVGGNPELIDDGISGILVPPDDVDAIASAIQRLGTHDAFRENIVQHARARVKDFSQEAVVGELQALLQNERVR